MNDPETWTTVCGIDYGSGGGLRRGGKRGKIGITVIE